jgi:hypothetical protein
MIFVAVARSGVIWLSSHVLPYNPHEDHDAARYRLTQCDMPFGDFSGMAGLLPLVWRVVSRRGKRGSINDYCDCEGSIGDGVNDSR